MDTIGRRFESAAGEQSLRTATAADAVAGTLPRLVAEPAHAAGLARVLARAAELGQAVVPRGGGTKLAWGAAPRAVDLILSTVELDAVLEHVAGDMTVTVQAGCTIGRLQEAVAEHRQRLALDPLFASTATVGGVLATNDSGSLRVAFGSARDQLIGITVALPDGRTARSGGRVVKNVAGYDLPKLFIGSFGTLGVITEATFRLYPKPRESTTLAFHFADEHAAVRFLGAVVGSTLAPTGAQLHVDVTGASQVAVRLEGFTARSVHDRETRLREIAGSSVDVVETGSGEEVWQTRERLYTDPRSAVVGKLTFLTSELSPLLRQVRDVLRPAMTCELIAQAIGVGDIRISGADPDVVTDVGSLVGAVEAVGNLIRRCGGSFMVREAPPGLRAEIDVWGPTGDALSLMRRVKEQFDPKGILSPGRFVGGI